MRRIFTLLLVIGVLPVHTTARQTAAAKAPDKPPIRACTLLTKELITKVTPNKNTKLMFLIPPSEDDLGTTGSACEYGGVHLQIDPFTPARLDALYKEHVKEWTLIPGVGDAAYFRDNRGLYAELYSRAGPRVFTIQMSVPDGQTAESIKPNVVALAREIIPKLQ